jgi:ATPase family associated with various cellular activities (AAA)
MRSRGGWVAYAPLTRAAGQAAADVGDRPELADVGRLARRLVRQAIHAARADEASIQRRLADHLGAEAGELPVASSSWPRYDQVNVQAGVDAWLAEPGREHEVAGITGFGHRMFGLADLAQLGTRQPGLGLGSVTTDLLPSGPDAATLACVQCALYLVSDADGPVALLVRGPEEHMSPGVTVEAVAGSAGRAHRAVDDIRRLSIARNVFRGHVIEFGGEVFGYDRDALLSFQPRPRVARDEVILPPDVLDGIERQVLGVARHASRLLASGQHLKRGILLHGAPGTGKTHTIRYLLGQLAGVTVLLLSGRALGMIAEACSVARTLQPSVVVVEDVDLIAEQRDYGEGEHPLLFQLLNEMDGLGEDLDITFLLTTNRADLLEPALAQRPGRVDHAALLPVPDADARLRLLHLYQGQLVLDLSDPGAVISRTGGVTASFMKELLRRAALRAADESGPEDAGTPIRVTDAHLATALDQLLDTRNELTRVLLGGQAAEGGAQRAGDGGEEP